MKKAPTKIREKNLRKQLFLNKEEIAEMEICSIGCAKKIMTNMRKWKKQTENKNYPKGFVLADDFFNHFWLTKDNKNG